MRTLILSRMNHTTQRLASEAKEGPSWKLRYPRGLKTEPPGCRIDKVW